MSQPIPSNDITGALQRAQRAHHDGNFTTVEQESRWVIEQQPDNAEAWVLMSTVARHYQRLPEAVEMLRRAVSLKPDNTYMQEALAELYLEQRDWRNAEALYQRLYDDRRDSGLLHPLGKCAWGSGRYESALRLFRSGAEADAGPAVRLSLAQAYLSLAQPENARSVLQALLKQHPRYAPGWMLLAMLEFNDAAPARAIELMAHAAKLPDANAKIHQFHAALLTLADRPDAAKDALRKVPDNRRTRAQWQSFQYALSHRSNVRFFGFGEQVLLFALNAANVSGMTLEFGVRHGRSLKLIAAQVKNNLHGFDDLRELPRDRKPSELAESDSTGDQRPELPRQAQLHAGSYNDTLPRFFAANKKPIRFAHVDCDSYSSTRTVLKNMLPNLCRGSVLVFDDYLGYPGYEEQAFKAFHEFTSEHELQYRYLAFDLLGRQAAVEVTHR